MKIFKRIFILFVFVFLLTACSNNSNPEPKVKDSSSQTKETKEIEADETSESTEETTTDESDAPPEDKVYFHMIKIPSPSIGDNLFDVDSEQSASVVLPPSYHDDTDKKYPVVYYLHGFGEGHDESLRFMLGTKEMEKEFIIVGVNGRNSLRGSFYVNSPAIGNWEDYVIKDVISYIENNYRVLAQKESRGIAGFSMGGFSAINLAFKYPDVFSSVFSISPGLFAENGLKKAFPMWNSTFLNAYGAAFSPDVNIEKPYAKIPKFDNTDTDNKIIDDWENGFGNLEEKIAQYQAKDNELKAIQIDYGSADRYTWIPDGCKYLSKLLDKHGIDHTLFEFDGTHCCEDSINNRAIPYFSQHLEAKLIN